MAEKEEINAATMLSLNMCDFRTAAIEKAGLNPQICRSLADIAEKLREKYTGINEEEYLRPIIVAYLVAMKKI